jgi:hypothetical protein
VFPLISTLHRRIFISFWLRAETINGRKRFSELQRGGHLRDTFGMRKISRRESFSGAKNGAPETDQPAA